MPKPIKIPEKMPMKEVTVVEYNHDGTVHRQFTKMVPDFGAERNKLRKKG